MAKQLKTLVRQKERVQARIKAAYKEDDQLTEELMMRLTPGVPADIGSGLCAVLRDNWAGKSKVFKTSVVQRFTLEVIPAAE